MSIVEKKERASSPSPAKIDTVKKYGENAISELKIRDTKSDATLFYMINAIDKEVRAEACKEILKRALTDIFFGVNETELVRQKDLVDYISDRNAPTPSKQWMFSSGAVGDIIPTQAIVAKQVVVDGVDSDFKTDEIDDKVEDSLESYMEEEQVEIDDKDIINSIKAESSVVEDFEDDSPF